jgi:uncharacterized protein DUF695
MLTKFILAIAIAVIAAVAALGIARASARSRNTAPRPVVGDLEARLDAFWGWWRTAAPRLAATIDAGKAASIASEVGAQVDAIDPRLSWETGPGLKGAHHHLALSPEGDIELRVLTERWLSRAPPPDKTWEHYAARQAFVPAGQWSLKLGGVTIDPASATVVFETDAVREIVHVTLHHPGLMKLDGSERARAAFLTLDNLLGEDSIERWVGKVDTSVTALLQGKSLDALAAAVETLKKTATGDRFAVLQGKTAGGQPTFASVNLALKRLDHLLMDNHLTVTVPLQDPTPDGLTTKEEATALNALEDELLDKLGHDAVYIGRETGQGKRILHLHVSAQGPAEERARGWAKQHPGRAVEIAVRHDPRWEVLRRW